MKFLMKLRDVKSITTFGLFYAVFGFWAQLAQWDREQSITNFIKGLFIPISFGMERGNLFRDYYLTLTSR